MTESFTARFAAELSARIVRRHSLTYSSGADEALDRPAHVRAASAIQWLADELVIVQDDASFLAHVDLTNDRVHATPLPAGPDGMRQFDKSRGNKQHKLDLEACFACVHRGVPSVIAFGSGSSPARETFVVLEARSDGPHVATVHAKRLYDAFRTHPTFATTELNLEGAAFLGSHVRLFQRSNGTPRDARAARCATVDLAWDALRAFLAAPDDAPLPALERVRHYDLGAIDGVRLTFTDACAVDAGRIWFLASAEASPDAIEDGEVEGTVVGLMEHDGRARLAWLVDEHGARVRDKAEGIVPAHADGVDAYVVFDPDDPVRAATLAEVRLSGPWRGMLAPCSSEPVRS